jgi:hypothetical protein
MEIEEFMKEVKAGDKIIFKGYEWIVLDPEFDFFDGGALVVMAENWRGEEFKFNEVGEAGCNNYATSSLRKLLSEELLPELGEDNLIPCEVSLLADNGDDAYGEVKDKVFILNMELYRRYKKVMPKWDNWTWTCTPWYCLGQTAGNANNVRTVTPDGSVHNNNAYRANGVTPACVLRIGNLKSRAQARCIKLEEKDG